MTLTITLDGNWRSFQLPNSTPPLSVTDSAIAPSARMVFPAALILWQYLLHLIGKSKHDDMHKSASPIVKAAVSCGSLLHCWQQLAS